MLVKYNRISYRVEMTRYCFKNEFSIKYYSDKNTNPTIVSSFEPLFPSIRIQSFYSLKLTLTRFSNSTLDQK